MESLHTVRRDRVWLKAGSPDASSCWGTIQRCLKVSGSPSLDGASAIGCGKPDADHVRPVLRDASDPELGGPFDLVTIFEALHDMNPSHQGAAAARASLAEGASVVIADERVAERFTAPGDEIERLNYGFSILHCLAVGLLDDDSAGTGTVIRPDTVRAYATDAGFDCVDVLPIEHDFWRFYRLVP